MRRVERAFVMLNGTVLVLLLATMSVVVGWNVAGRYLTGNSLTWADEVARYSMIWLTFLGSGLALREGAHAAITNAQDALPTQGQLALRAAILVVMFSFFAFMVWVGIDYMNRMAIQKSAALRVPMKWVYAAMPAGFVLMIVHLALIAPKYWRAGQQHSDEAPLVEILIAAFLILMVMGVPIAFALAMAAFAAVGLSGRYPLVVVVKEMFTGLDSFPLLAVPFFILAAEIMSTGAISRMLLRFASQFVGHLRGGLGYANVLSSTLFAGISGSALADAAGPGAMMVRMMERSGYAKSYAGALTISASVVGPIIPPSITMIIYAMQDRNVSVGSLFMAGILPGLLISAAMAAVNWHISRKRGYRSGEPRPPVAQMLRNSFVALPALMLIVLIVGGIRGGIFTPTEASVVAVFYAILTSAFIYRGFTLQDLWGAFLRSAIMSVAVLMILASARAFAWILIIEGVPQTMASAVIAMDLSPIAFLLMVNLLLLVFGMFMDPLPGVMILVPILAPIAHSLGIAADHFAIVVIVNLTFGLMTPPVGALIFVVSSATKQKPSALIRELPPFFLAALVVLLILILVPSLSTWLPKVSGFSR